MIATRRRSLVPLPPAGPGALLVVLFALACTQTGSPVGPGSNRAPLIRSLTLTPNLVPLGGEALIELDAGDPDGDTLFFRYAAEAGTVTPEPDKPWRARYVNDAARGAESDRIVATVTDTRNASSSFTASLTLQSNRPPELRLPDSDPCHPACRGGFDNCNATCDLNFLARVSDPEGQTLSYEWGGCVTDSNGTRGTCRITQPGIYTATLIVRDARGASVLASARGQGTNRAPSVTGGGTVHARDRRLLINESDPDGDPLKCAWAGTCQCTGDTQSYNQNCSIPSSLSSCFETATCFDPFGALGETRFDMLAP